MFTLLLSVLVLFSFSYENLMSSDDRPAVQLVSVDVSQKLALTTLLAAKENATQQWAKVDRNYNSTSDKLENDESKMSLKDRVEKRFIVIKNLNISIDNFLGDSSVDFRKATDVLQQIDNESSLSDCLDTVKCTLVHTVCAVSCCYACGNGCEVAWKLALKPQYEKAHDKVKAIEAMERE